MAPAGRRLFPLRRNSGGTCDYWHWVDAEAWGDTLRAVEIRYPGRGSAVCHTLGHPEPLTLPRHFPGLRESLNLMNMPGFVIAELQDLQGRIDSGELTVPQAAESLRGRWSGDGLATVLEGAKLITHTVLDAVRGRPTLPRVAALAVGLRSGRPSRVAVSITGIFPGGMGALTGYPAAVVAGLIAQGKVAQPGVFAPEAAVPADPFFAALAQLADRPDPSARFVLYESD